MINVVEFLVGERALPLVRLLGWHAVIRGSANDRLDATRRAVSFATHVDLREHRESPRFALAKGAGKKFSDGRR
jgi:hypothetical protein